MSMCSVKPKSYYDHQNELFFLYTLKSDSIFDLHFTAYSIPMVFDNERPNAGLERAV